MINRVVLVGRMTKDPEVRKTQSGLSTVRFTLACDRRFQSRDAQGPTADFISCVAWRQSADFLGNYAHKGSIVGVEGRITTGSYEGQNGRVYTTDVTCDSVQLIGGAPRENSNQTYTPQANNSYQQANRAPENSYNSNFEDDFSNTPSLDISSDDLPFY